MLFTQSGNKPNLNLPSDSAKVVQTVIDSNVQSSTQGLIDKVVNSTSSTFSTVKSYVGSSCSKLYDYFSNAFHSSGNKAKIVQSPIDKKLLKDRLIAAGTVIAACDPAIILTCLLLTRFK